MKTLGLHMDASCQSLLLVDLRFPKLHLAGYFMDWLSNLQLPKIILRTKPRGTAAKPPWHCLRELAAYRLATHAHMNHKSVIELIDKTLEPDEIRTHERILPSYPSPAGFSGAVSNAAQRIAELFPHPTTPSH